MAKVRISARSALGRGTQLRRAAELELTPKCGIEADPQVTLDIYTIRALQQARRHDHVWPPTVSEWAKTYLRRRGRGPLPHLKTIC
eukprot:2609986-Amphidinium_carterae.1